MEYNLIPYGEGAFIVKKLEILEDEKEYLDYKYLGVDCPIIDDNVWRFWIEYGYINGESCTVKADLTRLEKSNLKKIIMENLENNK